LFVKNRGKLSKLLAPGSVVVVQPADRMPRNGDQNFAYRQNSDLLYLTGVAQEETILLVHVPLDKPDEVVEVLYILKADKMLETWEGKKLSADEARAISGIKTVKHLDDFERDLETFSSKADILYLNRNENPRYKPEVRTRDERFISHIKERFPLHKLERLAPLLQTLRVEKEPEEIELMKKAGDITRAGFTNVLAMMKPGIFEFEVEAVLSSTFIKAGANGHAFEPIVASGKNACYLHYVKNNAVVGEGELVLIDFVAEYGNYSSDCTRTVPASGQFTPRQRQVYDACHSVFLFVQSIVKPGTTIAAIQAQTCLKMQEELMKLGLFGEKDVEAQDKSSPLYTRYFMHGVSHFLGLDTHDVGSKDMVLAPGMVITCEPGIYIQDEGVGVRIETDLLITPAGNVDLLREIPSSSAEIEQIMTRTRTKNP